MFDFDLEPFMLSKITTLFSLDKDSDTFKIVYTDDAVRIKGDSYNAKLLLPISHQLKQVLK